MGFLVVHILYTDYFGGCCCCRGLSKPRISYSHYCTSPRVPRELVLGSPPCTGLGFTGSTSTISLQSIICNIFCNILFYDTFILGMLQKWYYITDDSNRISPYSSPTPSTTNPKRKQRPHHPSGSSPTHSEKRSYRNDNQVKSGQHS